eukprot:5648968-Pyramimonas_sp.AAC.1
MIQSYANIHISWHVRFHFAGIAAGQPEFASCFTAPDPLKFTIIPVCPYLHIDLRDGRGELVNEYLGGLAVLSCSAQHGAPRVARAYDFRKVDLLFAARSAHCPIPKPINIHCHVLSTQDA